MKYSATAQKYSERGIPVDGIDAHSYLSRGVCALNIAGYNNNEIRKMG